MPLPIFLERLKKRSPFYLLEDRFDGIVSPGFINNTRSTSGHLRIGTDTESKLSIANGVLTFAGGKAVPTWGDPGYYYNLPVPRVAGRALFVKSKATTNPDVIAAWHGSAAVPSFNDSLYNLRFDSTYIDERVLNIDLAAYTNLATYTFAIVLRASGAFYFATGSTQFPTWTLLFVSATGTTDPLYVGLCSYSAASTRDDIIIPDQRWSPSPLASDSFVRGNGALGLTDGLGHAEANGGGNVAWQFDAGVWTIATNKAVGTPSVGAGNLFANANFAVDEPVGTAWARQTGWTIAGGKASFSGTANALISQTLSSIGTWVQCNYDIVDAYTGSSLGIKARNAYSSYNKSAASYIDTLRLPDTSCGFYVAANDASTIGIDNASVQALTLSSLFSTIPAGTANVKVRATVAALTAGTQAGVAIVNSATTPTQGVVFYLDGAGNAKADEFTAATTWNALATAVSAFAAGDQIELDVSGNAWRCYKITAAGVATLIGSGTFTAALGATPYAGLFSTYNGNTFSACTVWAKGNESQYSVLDQLGA